MFSLVTHIDSTSPIVFFNTGMIYWASGDCKNALECMEKNSGQVIIIK